MLYRPLSRWAYHSILECWKWVEIPKRIKARAFSSVDCALEANVGTFSIAMHQGITWSYSAVQHCRQFCWPQGLQRQDVALETLELHTICRREQSSLQKIALKHHANLPLVFGICNAELRLEYFTWQERDKRVTLVPIAWLASPTGRPQLLPSLH